VPVLAVTLRDGGYDLHDLRRTASATDRGASSPGQLRTFATPVRLAVPAASRRRGSTLTLARRQSAKSRGCFEAEIRETIAFQVEGLREDGLPIPAPPSQVDYAEIAA
jgi:hypothetical protein